jgi:hypothetical protein
MVEDNQVEYKPEVIKKKQCLTERRKQVVGNLTYLLKDIQFLIYNDENSNDNVAIILR